MPTKKRPTRSAKNRKTRARRRAAVVAIEAVRRAPLEPAVPVDPDALDRLDPDTLEVLGDTQTLADDEPARTAMDEAAIARKEAAALTGGDVDAVADDTGEETVGGSTPTPDQDVVDDLGRAVGVTYGPGEPLRLEEKEAARDDRRWEVDPASDPEYPERQRALRTKAAPPRSGTRGSGPVRRVAKRTSRR